MTDSGFRAIEGGVDLNGKMGFRVIFEGNLPGASHARCAGRSCRAGGTGGAGEKRSCQMAEGSCAGENHRRLAGLPSRTGSPAWHRPAFHSTAGRQVAESDHLSIHVYLRIPPMVRENALNIHLKVVRWSNRRTETHFFEEKAFTGDEYD